MGLIKHNPASPLDAVTIRRITDLEGCRHFQALDDLIWGAGATRATWCRTM
jgi:hypothetical protein